MSARGGYTVVELLVVMLLGTAVLAGATTVFLGFQRAAEQRDAVRDVQDEIYGSVERLVRLVRSADSISTTSTSTRLVVVGGLSPVTCDNSRCWVEATADGLVAAPPTGASGVTRTLAPGFDSLAIAFGIDADDDGTLGSSDFESSPGSDPEAILGVRFLMEFEAARGRGSFHDAVQVHAAIRSRILNRLVLTN